MSHSLLNVRKECFAHLNFAFQLAGSAKPLSDEASELGFFCLESSTFLYCDVVTNDCHRYLHGVEFCTNAKLPLSERELLLSIYLETHQRSLAERSVRRQMFAEFRCIEIK